MSGIYPRLQWREWGWSLLLALGGALVAGTYGIAHDLVTYALGPEYFSHFKFLQFQYADLGWPRRVFAAEIGFLATWWVGFLCAWFLARVAVPRWPIAQAARKVAQGTVWICVCTFAAGCTGYGYGRWVDPSSGRIADFARDLWVQDVTAFVRVGYIHNAGYLGALLGLLTALAWLFRLAPPRKAIASSK